MTQLSDLEGKKIAIGREGSGTRRLSLNLLEANGIARGGVTQLVPLDGMDAAKQLVAGNVDAALLNGDSTTRGLMLRLLGIPGISVMDFAEASAYTRLFSRMFQTVSKRVDTGITKSVASEVAGFRLRQAERNMAEQIAKVRRPRTGVTPASPS